MRTLIPTSQTANERPSPGKRAGVGDSLHTAGSELGLSRPEPTSFSSHSTALVAPTLHPAPFPGLGLTHAGPSEASADQEGGTSKSFDLLPLARMSRQCRATGPARTPGPTHAASGTRAPCCPHPGPPASVPAPAPGRQCLGPGRPASPRSLPCAAHCSCWSRPVGGTDCEDGEGLSAQPAGKLLQLSRVSRCVSGVGALLTDGATEAQ